MELEYTDDLGKITVMSEYLSLPLPYYKPYGVDKIPLRDSDNIKIYKLVVDDNTIRPWKNQAIIEPGNYYSKPVDIEGGFFSLQMDWSWEKSRLDVIW
ncbi:MAG: hypothetical protein LBT84_06955 [Spirochaetia bacterium]|nr:hypothetical protein [Spirochaetia bacterium]